MDKCDSKPLRKRTKNVALPPVDAGWAWVVVAAASIIFGLQATPTKIFGILYVEMLENFKSDPATTLWINAVTGMVVLCSGPLVALLLHNITHRGVMIIGAVCMSGGIIATGFVPVLEAAFFTYGIVHGFGLSCLNVAALTCTATYFEKYRGLAIGITASGAGLFSFIGPNILRALFDSYTFSGALLIYGGVAFSLLPVILLVRPFSMYQKKQPWQRNPRVDGKCEVEDALAQVIPNGNDSNACICSAKSMPYPGRASGENVSETYLSGNRVEPTNDSGNRFIIHDTNVVLDAPCTSPKTSPLDDFDDSAVIATSIVKNGSSSAKQSSFDCSLFGDERMIVMGASMLFISNGMTIVFSIIPPYCESVGISRWTTSILLSISGICEIIGNGFHGLISDKHFMPALVHVGLCVAIAGAAALMCPILGGEVGVGILSAACGLFGMSAWCLLPVTVRELMGTERTNSALSIQMVYRSPAFLISTYMAGYLKELTGVWETVFYFVGGNFLAGAFLSGGYAALRRIRDKRLLHKVSKPAF